MALTTTGHDLFAAFSRDLDRGASGPAPGLFGWAGAVFRCERRCGAALATMRAALSLCVKACPSGECMAEMYRTASRVRDNYIVLAACFERLPVPGFVRRRITASLAEWDDLAEDCAVGSDPDIRAALSEIASRI